MNAQAMSLHAPAAVTAGAADRAGSVAHPGDLAALDRLARRVAGDPVLAERLAAAAAARGLHAAALAEGHDIGAAPLLQVIMCLAESFDRALTAAAGRRAPDGGRRSA
ncbi:hypothetical protein GCM10011505_37810 [Tistrella bauzanensis]|uniref:Uncharacterized protein n=1 Tax=Tistrella bauzanensis TaxID=657419 RepID=A0ABQ1IV99_9PROT|nr:hypothetical protein [Tistrella bauzanensis]GGB53217.1 hypothetical protein GCM10011505_37810 [Tistrella bauzanensis]